MSKVSRALYLCVSMARSDRLTLLVHLLGAAFANGTLVKWQIEPDAQSKNQNDVVGWASNPYQRFTVHKADKGKWIFKNNDGYDCFAVYYAY